MIDKHKSNKIKENSNTVRHLNNGTDHRHSKSCCDQSSPARRTISIGLDNDWSPMRRIDLQRTVFFTGMTSITHAILLLKKIRLEMNVFKYKLKMSKFNVTCIFQWTAMARRSSCYHHSFWEQTWITKWSSASISLGQTETSQWRPTKSCRGHR